MKFKSAIEYSILKYESEPIRSILIRLNQSISQQLILMTNTDKLLEELIELQKASIRLQKFAITLQAESSAYLYMLANANNAKQTQVERIAMKAVKQMRATINKIEKGKALPK